MADLILAILHHLLVFGLVAMLAIERALLRGETVDAIRLARLDAGFGATAALVIAVGVGRVLLGGKGWAFYVENPFFWTKMASFLLIGLLSIAPTLLFIRWRKASAGGRTFAPPADELKRARRWLGLEALLLIPLLASAAATARWPF
ncbi:MAG: hypothetical protein A2623_09685 [Caulobacterales bacterium RIFCSPHIGHO2_01_FULL_70_19]|nr:MAG: hypothetical protein A2623_09685 [Caulobacterales bacterium RIFCSPHIGHO2_01_FULL_70_19]